ncbi:hypothetical protein [Brevundimonas nasdae]|uniref:hypothetical protein n=1 Tax=Brevundimonas nasdae TaxID=172043 RepID=UPI003F68DBF6
MTHHIIRSEAGRPLPHVQIRTASGRRRRRATGSEVIAAHLAAIGVGAGAGLADVLIGQPVCIVLVGLAYGAWCFWPAR